MGWFSDAVNQVTHAVGDGVQAIVGTGQAILEGGGIEATGEKVAKRFNQAVGAGYTIATGGITETQAFQEAADNQDVDKWTLGVSGDFAGTGRAATSGRYLRDISPEDLADATRLGGKLGAATLGAAYIGYNTSEFGTSLAGPSWLTGSNAAYAGIGYGALTRGSVNSNDALALAGVDVPPGTPNVAIPVGGRSPATSAPRLGPSPSTAQIGSVGGGGGTLAKAGVDPKLAVGAVALLVGLLIYNRMHK